MSEHEQAELRRLAEAVVAGPFLSLLGIQADEIRRGFCRVRLHVEPKLLNVHGVIHGGAVFTLADVCAAVAMRSLGANVITLQASINLVGTGNPGDDLVAEANAVHLGRRTGVAQATVTNQQNRIVATGNFTFVRLEGRGHDTLATMPAASESSSGG